MIEKIIHYCWFGENPKSDLIIKCIESWKKYCPDYKIIEWNENNFDVNMYEYTKQAYELKKYAFVSDVARLWAIYNYGGIYLDTDVELYKSLDELLNYEAFFCFENARSIATGLGCGASINNLLIKKMLDDYEEREFISNETINLSLTCAHINTPILQREVPTLEKNDKTQIINNIAFLSSSYMNEISKHYGERSWLNGFDKSMVKKHGKIKSYILNNLRNPKIFKFINKYCNKKIEKIYEFFVYDFFDLGIIYYIKRKINKKI